MRNYMYIVSLVLRRLGRLWPWSSCYCFSIHRVIERSKSGMTHKDKYIFNWYTAEAKPGHPSQTAQNSARSMLLCVWSMEKWIDGFVLFFQATSHNYMCVVWIMVNYISPLAPEICQCNFEFVIFKLISFPAKLPSGSCNNASAIISYQVSR